MSSVKDLLRICNDAVEDQEILCLFWWSLFPNPENITKLIKIESVEEKFSPDTFDDFIKICDNRIDMAKSLLKDLSIIFSAIFVAFSVIATILAVSDSSKMMASLSGIFSPLVLTILIIILIFCILALLTWIGYLRVQIYTWAS